MKKKFIVAAYALILIINCRAQSAAIKPLQIGDRVPDISFNNVLNYKTKSVSLSQFKNKVIVIDFWAPWCSPCVAGLPGLSRLQKQFGDSIVVLPISVAESEDVVKSFFDRRKDIQLPNIVGSADFITELKKLFPFTGIPHSVIIDKSGKLVALTTSEQINAQVISRTLKNEPPGLAVKKDNMRFKSGISILDGSHADIDRSIIKHYYQSVLTSQIDGIGSGATPMTSDSTRKGYQLINRRIGQLYSYALNNENLWRWQIQSDHPKWKEEVQFHTRKASLWTYEYTTDTATSDELIRQRMRSDLDNVFGVKSEWIKQSLPSFSLVIYNKNKPPQKSSSERLLGADDETARIANYSTKEISDILNTWLYVPVLDSTGINYPINISISHSSVLAWLSEKRHDIEPLRGELRAAGLDLVPSTGTFDILFLKQQ